MKTLSFLTLRQTSVLKNIIQMFSFTICKSCNPSSIFQSFCKNENKFTRVQLSRYKLQRNVQPLLLFFYFHSYFKTIRAIFACKQLRRERQKFWMNTGDDSLFADVCCLLFYSFPRFDEVTFEGLTWEIDFVSTITICKSIL